MFSRIVTILFGLLLIALLLVTFIYIPEVYILWFAGFLYACVRSLKNEEFKEKFIIKSEKKLYISIGISIVIIIALVIYFVVVDSSTLYYTMFIGLCVFAIDIKKGIESIFRKR